MTRSKVGIGQPSKLRLLARARHVSSIAFSTRAFPHQKARLDAIFADISPPGPWDAFAYTDGRIVTGANPASAHITAEEAVNAFNKL